MTEDNMELWNQVCETDPKITKKVNQRGGFTAIDAQGQIKRATELWGPYGGNWGVSSCNFGMILDEKGAPVELYLDAQFYFPAEKPDDSEIGGSFPISSDIAYRAGGDSRKKLLTDVTTKALSKLGFNSDVFEGKFDDNKYVNAMKEKHMLSSTPEEIDADAKMFGDDFFEQRKAAFMGAADGQDLLQLWGNYYKDRNKVSEEQREELLKIKNGMKEQFDKPID